MGYWTVATNSVVGSNEVDVPMVTCTWEEVMIQKERERSETLHSQLLEFHSRNRKDDTTPWLLFTKWPELFEGKDLKLIAETRYLNTDNRQVLTMSQVSKSQLRVVNHCFDRLLEWCLETLETMEWDICCWLRSPRRSECSHSPFKKPQQTSTLVRYRGYWKQLLHFCLRTALLDRETQESIYGIEFTARQTELASDLRGEHLFSESN
jgi:hypothetical protein